MSGPEMIALDSFRLESSTLRPQAFSFQDNHDLLFRPNSYTEITR